MRGVVHRGDSTACLQAGGDEAKGSQTGDMASPTVPSLGTRTWSRVALELRTMAAAAPPTLERDLAQALHALSKECTRAGGGLTSWLVGGGTQHTDVHAAIAAAEVTLQQVSSRTASGYLDEVSQ